MNRADDEVEAVEYVVRVVETSVGEDVGFDPLENAKSVRCFVQLVDLVELREHAMTFVVASGEALFDAYLHGTARTGGLLSEQTPEALAAIRAEVVERCRPYQREGRLELPMPAFIASGRRPSGPLAL